MTEITTNVASTIKSTDYNTTKSGEEKPQAKQMVSIFSSYDNNQDNSVSYAQDSSTKSYMDAQKKSIDSMLSGLTQSVKDKIKVSPEQLWNNAVGSFSSLYQSTKVEEGQESVAKTEVDNQVKTMLDTQISNANSYIENAYQEAISAAQAEVAAEEAEAAAKAPEAGTPEKTPDAETPPKSEDSNDGSYKTLDDLKNSGVKVKTQTRWVNGKDQEYVIYKGPDGEKHRAIVKDDGTLDEIVQNGGKAGAFDTKMFVSQSFVKETLGMDKLPEGVTMVSYDPQNPQDATFEVHVGQETYTCNAQQVKTYALLHADQSGLTPSDNPVENPTTISELRGNGTRYSIKTREVNGYEQEYVIYKDNNGETHRAVLTADGKLDEIEQESSEFGQKTFISKNFLNKSTGLDKLPQNVFVDTYDYENPQNSRFVVYEGAGEYNNVSGAELKDYLARHKT